jgi:glycerol-3-phosphate acyltransferase PlsY
VILVTIAVLAGAYLVASLNFSIILLKLTGHGDPRVQKSGNPGTTNTARIAGRGFAALVLVLDVARAALVQVVAAHLSPPEWVPWAALALVLGNRFPLWHGFRGGKGVAALLGFVLALNPALALLSCLAWVGVYGLLRIPAAASMGMLLALSAAMIHQWPIAALPVTGTLLTTTLIVLAHGPNWKTLRNGKRSRPPST